ncbi:MAG TPA: type II secretion system secretin GspD [Alphaproteobacteria bacterium]|nr:type II secretion system secretin GspD [Alphaproteobacteria bacterium]
MTSELSLEKHRLGLPAPARRFHPQHPHPDPDPRISVLRSAGRRTLKARLRASAAIAAVGVLVACSPPGGWEGTPVDAQPISTKTRSVSTSGSSGEVGAAPAQKPYVKMGNGQAVQQPPTASSHAEENGDITLNFVNAAVKDVVDSVLGQTLHVNYTIDPKLQAAITMQTAKPIKRDDVLPLLEGVLQANGIAVVQTGDLYRVMALSGAAKAGGAKVSVGSVGQAGYGVQIIPLKYASAVQLQKVLEPFVPTGGVLQVDDSRNLLLVSGTRGDLDEFIRMVNVFDVDSMNGMSFAMFPLHQGAAGSVAKELATILNGANSGASNGAVRVIPLERINSILVVSAQPKYIQQAQDWIDRLDSGVDESAARLYVYYVQNGRASDLAKVLGQMYGGGTVANEQEVAPGNDISSLASITPGNGIGNAGAGLGGRLSGGMAGTPAPVLGGAGASPLPGGGGPAAGGQGSATGAGGLTTSGETTGALPPPVGVDDRSSLMGGTGKGGSQATRIVADEKNNALIIRARPAEYRKIEGALKKLDILPQQVLIEATIAEVTLNDSLNYGLQWFFKEHGMHATLSTAASGALNSAFPGFSAVFGSNSAQAVLNALSDVTSVNIVSAPHLMVLDHQTAVLQVGDEVPIVSQQAVSTVTTGAPVVNSVQYLNTGVIMKVTPRVNANGVATLEIDQEVSSPTNTTSSTIDSPTISQRRIKTVVTVPNGQTLALGGMIQEQKNNTKSGIPLLSDIPILGALASNTNRGLKRTELLVLLTPTIVHDADEARDVTDELERRMHSLVPIKPKKI